MNIEEQPGVIPLNNPHKHPTMTLYEKFKKKSRKQKKTRLLLMLQAHTPPDATPPIGNIQPFSKIAVTFEPLMGF